MGEKRFANLVIINPGQVGDDHPANKYQPEFCDTVRQLGQLGQFPEEWVCALGVTLRTLYNWANAHPEFEQAMNEAHWLCRAFWARKARESVQGVGMAPSVLAMILERRFGDMWGKKSINMHEHFEARNAPKPAPAAVPGQADQPIRTRETILAEIAVLQERLKQRQER